jgi:ferric-dicitrate binding protein FerR (iron transport regulator)
VTPDRNDAIARTVGSGAGEPDPVAALLRRAGPPPAPDPERRTRVAAAAREAWLGVVAIRRRRRRALAAFAALAAAVVGVLMFRVTSDARHSISPRFAPDGRVATLVAAVGEVRDSVHAAALPVGSDLAPGARITTSAGVRAAFALGGGRTMRLDESSRVEFPARGLVRLAAGALYVDSPVPSRTPPITVLTPLGGVREKGTRFEVRLGPSSLSVTVRGGRVAIWRGADRAEARAGERLGLDAHGSWTRATVSAADPAWAWTWGTGLGFAIEGATLERFLGWYRMESGRTATVAPAGPDPSDVVLHGSIAGLAPDAALAVVARSAGLTVRPGADGGRALEPAATGAR